MINILENASQEYDLGSNIDFEAYCAICKNAKEERNKLYFDFYKISKSITRVKNRIINLH